MLTDIGLRPHCRRCFLDVPFAPVVIESLTNSQISFALRKSKAEFCSPLPAGLSQMPTPLTASVGNKGRTPFRKDCRKHCRTLFPDVFCPQSSHISCSLVPFSCFPFLPVKSWSQPRRRIANKRRNIKLVISAARPSERYHSAFGHSAATMDMAMKAL